MKNSIQEIINHALKGGKFRFYDDYFNVDFISKLHKIIIREGQLWYSSPKDEICVEAPSVEIIKPERKLKDPVSIMKTLVEGGWNPDDNGVFIHKVKSAFAPRMWQDCGKEESKWFTKWTVDPSWIEEE